MNGKVLIGLASSSQNGIHTAEQNQFQSTGSINAGLVTEVDQILTVPASVAETADRTVCVVNDALVSELAAQS